MACIPASWAWALLLPDELFDKRQPLAYVPGLGLDFRYRELRLDIHLLELAGILVVIGAEGLAVLNPPDGLSLSRRVAVGNDEMPMAA